MKHIVKFLIYDRAESQTARYSTVSIPFSMFQARIGRAHKIRIDYRKIYRRVQDAVKN